MITTESILVSIYMVVTFFHWIICIFFAVVYSKSVAQVTPVYLKAGLMLMSLAMMLLSLFAWVTDRATAYDFVTFILSVMMILTLINAEHGHEKDY